MFDLSSRRGDARVQRALDEHALKYEVDEEGDFRLLFSLENGRSQMLFVNSGTERFYDLEIREVWSLAIGLPGLPEPGLMLYLLKQNREAKFGSWRIGEDGKGGHYILFAAQVSADADADTLAAMMEMVMHQADGLEAMFGRDDY